MSRIAGVHRFVAVPMAALLLVGGGISAVVVALPGAPAGATAITVVDETSFRSAWDSNLNDTIVLGADIHLSVGTCSSAVRTTAAGPITIDGQGQFKIIQDCAGNGVLEVDSQSNTTLRGVTITGANGSGSGGGMEFAPSGPATLTVDHTTFLNNLATNDTNTDGGAIDMNSAGNTLVVTDSSFLGNKAGDDAGAIDCNDVNQTLTITRSTFAGNATTGNNESQGGTIDLESSACHLTMVNSTVTGSNSRDLGAISGENNTDTITLVYTDIVNNTFGQTVSPFTAPSPSAQAHPHPSKPDPVGTETLANSPANLFLPNASNLTLFGSVIARPHNGANCAQSGGAPMTGVVSSGYNLADDTSCGLTAATDKQGAANDPLLAFLANNGGPTQTLLPLSGSPLIDAIPAAACQSGPAAGITTDQRGVSRPQGVGCDIGAVEVAVAILVQPRFTG
jgi:hypothetical protein